MDKTTMVDLDEIKCALVETTLDEVKDALVSEGYNPVSQIVGYLISGDPSYITSKNGARDKMLSIERSKVLEAMVKEYLGL